METTTAANDPLISNQSEHNAVNKSALYILLSIIVVLLVIVIILSVTGANGSWPFTEESTKDTANYKQFKFQWAPFTPSLDDYSPEAVPTINYSAIPYLAATAQKFGAENLFIGGSNAQFDTMTVDERKQLIGTWVNVTVAGGYDFYLIFQICSTKLFESVELAAYARELYDIYGKPDAVGSLPPFYEKPSTTDQFEQLMTWFRPVVDAAAPLPFWYYHLPGRTLVDLEMNEFVDYAYNGNAQGTSLRELKGAKYVAASGSDIFLTTSQFSDDANGGMYGGFAMMAWNSQTPIMSFSAFDKLAGFGQDYYWIPVSKCMLKAVENGRYDEAYDYEEWRREMAFFLPVGSVARRCLHQRISGFDMGPPRQPDIPIQQSECDELLDALDGVGFFDEIERQIRECVK